jgi:uncharacterized protein (TIGR03435 family)
MLTFPMRLTHYLRAALLALFLLLTPPAPTQTTPAQPTPQTKASAYDVVSIRVDNSGPNRSSTGVDDGIFTATNVTFKDLLEDAFDIRQDIIFGVPGPIDSLRFDVQAKIVADRDTLHKVSDSQRRAMLQLVLTERFHLKAHIESKSLPVYDLVLLKGGPRFKPSANQSSDDQSTNVHNTSLKASNMPIAVFCKTLSHQTQRTVIDKTGLPGLYDIELKWSRDDATDLPADAPPTFFTALQEQLGLKLQPSKGPVDTLVVDHVEMPSDN